MAIERAILEKYATEFPVLQSPDEGAAKNASTFAEQPQARKRAAQHVAPVPAPAAATIPEVFQSKLGLFIEDLLTLDGHANELGSDAYQLQEVVSCDGFSALFKARPKSAKGIPALVKIFDPVMLPQARADEFLEKVIDYQSAMYDVNILKVVGRGAVGTDTALLYEYMPTTLEDLVGQHAEGIPLEMMMEILPQILNALGYSHMHRGGDGKVARLSHLHLRPSKFLFDESKQVVKLEDCAVWRSLVEVRGYKKRLSEEPGVDLSALAPESFVIDSKFVNAFLVDIYALGVLLYRLATGQPPFFGSNYEEYRFEHLKKFAIPPKVHRYTVPKWLDEMIMKCLEKEPPHRWRSATQMELAIRKDVLQ
jgi:serine/threonine-protein kinase